MNSVCMRATQRLYAGHGRFVRSQYPCTKDSTQLGGHRLCHDVEQLLIAVFQVNIYQPVVRRIAEQLPFG